MKIQYRKDLFLYIDVINEEWEIVKQCIVYDDVSFSIFKLDYQIMCLIDKKMRMERWLDDCIVNEDVVNSIEENLKEFLAVDKQ